MKRLILLFALSALTIDVDAQSARIVCDETCREEFYKPEGRKVPVVDDGMAGYAVVSPLGISEVRAIAQAPRLQTLEGKNIAVVGVSFMTEVTHPEIRRLILKDYPSAKVFLLDEVGHAGPYNSTGTRRRQVEAFQQKLRDLRIDAVISGNGGCGLCTPKETGSCIAAEMLGIPSVMIAGPGFTDQARYTALNNGIGVLRIAEYPGAFASDSEEVIRRNVDDLLWPQIVEALTSPLTDEELAASQAAGGGDMRDDVFFGTLEEVNEYFLQQQWSDGLPIVPPTFDKVNEFLRFSPCRWDETIAQLPVANRRVCAWHVAVNAVMAGCRPEYMPVLIALVKGMGDGNFRRTLASTHAWMPYCWINGPLASRIGLDCGQGQINEAANIAIGRFMNLALMNLCGYYVKKDRMGTFGYPMPWCLVEDEQACRRVGWEPYHVRNGYSEDDSVVTLGSALLWGNNMAPSTLDPHMMVELLAWDISQRSQFALGSGRQYTFRTVLMTEPVAAILASEYKTPDDLEKALVQKSRRPLKERAFANYYANPGSRKDGGEHSLKQYTSHIDNTEGGRMTRTPSWYDTNLEVMKTVPTMRPGMTAFLVTGDAARNKVQTMPGGGYVSVRIELPENWEELLASLDRD